MEGYMKYAVEFGSGAMIYITNFGTINTGTQKLIRGDSHTHTYSMEIA
jgi:hypothetical protein